MGLTLTKKYLIAAFAIMLLFVNFIACGSQLYQVSLQDDVDDNKRAEQAAGGATESNAPFGIHSSGGWVNLPINMKFGNDVTDAQKKQVKKAMATWEKCVGKKLFNLGSDNQYGDMFKDLYGSLTDSINGTYMRNNWGATGKPTVVLATTIWNNSVADASKIDTADLHYNQEYYVIGDSEFDKAEGTKEIVDMESLSLHEIGHLLGLAHVAPEDDPYSIMNPTLFIGEGLTSRNVSKDDIGRIQSIYGCEGDACDKDALFESMQTPTTDEVVQ